MVQHGLVAPFCEMKNARWREDAAWVLVLVLNLSSNPENKVGSHCSPLSISSACPLVLSLGLMNARGRQRQGAWGEARAPPRCRSKGSGAEKAPGSSRGGTARWGVSQCTPFLSPAFIRGEGGEITPRGGREGGWEWGMGTRKGDLVDAKRAFAR